MKRKFITNLALLVFLNLLVKPFWVFGIDRTVQNTVGAEEYGFYFVLFNFSMILNILLDLGITNFNNRNIAQHNQLLSKHFSNIVVLKFSLSILYFVVSLLAAYFLNWSWKHYQLLLVLLLNQFISSFVLYLRSNLAGLHLFKTDSIVSVLDRTLLIFICSILLWGGVTEQKFKIEWLVYSQTIAYTITAVVAFVMVLSKTEFIRLRFDWSFFLVILKQSYPFALLTLLMAFYNRFDAVMLDRLLENGEQQAGIYAQSFRILETASMFAYLFAVLLLPIFSKMLKMQNPVNQLVALSSIMLLIPSAIIAVTANLYNFKIIDFLFEAHTEVSADVFGILMIGIIPISATYIFGTLLTANGNLRYLNYMALSGFLLNIILNFILIPRFEAYGAAITSISTQFYTAIIQIILCWKIFKFHLNRKQISATLIYLFVIISIGLVFRKYIESWFIAISVYVVFALVFAFVIRLISIRNLYEIVRYGEEQKVLQNEKTL